ncbi:MAG: hypothetical protein ACC652_03905, partial [Acidimicrobiales bacterium]
IYFVYMIRSVARRRRPRDEQLLIFTAAGAYGVNVLLGAAHVFTKVSSSLLVATHLLMAALVWSCLVAAVVMATHSSPSVSPRDHRVANSVPTIPG